MKDRRNPLGRSINPVSYTHLDVYKRQDIEAAEASANESNEVNAANAGRANKDGYKKPYKGGKNRRCV